MIDEKIWNIVRTGSPGARIRIFSEHPYGSLYFAAWYFPQYFIYKIPPFHKDFYDDIRDLSTGNKNEAMWIAFREGAKTSIAKIAFVLWLICLKKKSYIGWDSYDGTNAENALFDITTELQTNKRLIADFGHLYFKKKEKDALSEAKMKRIKNFITENGVKVVTFSTQQSIRGQIKGHERLDCMIFDDFENNKTKDSPVTTASIIEHINEYRSGMPVYAVALYLCNYLTDSGSVADLMGKLQNNPKKSVRFIKVVDEETGEIAWPDKYVHTDKEAFEINRGILDPKKHKISLESKRRDLKDSVYETEFMLNPAKSGDLYFDREKVDAAIKRSKKPIDIISGFNIWAKFNPKHMYGAGADTAEGIGGDYNTDVYIDFKQKPALVVGTFSDNELSNTQHAWSIKRHGAIFGYPYLIPEINNTGYGTVAELQTAEYPNIHVRDQKNQTTGKTTKEYGWKATVGTVGQVMSEFKEAFESGELEILDAALLGEMRIYTKANARQPNRIKGATRHFDLLRAAALAWEARKFATLPKEENDAKYYVSVQSEPYRQ